MWGHIGHKFITDIGRTIAGITENPKSTSFIFQAISMAVQQGNVQCVQGAYGEHAFEELDEIFYRISSYKALLRKLPATRDPRRDD